MEKISYDKESLKIEPIEIEKEGKEMKSVVQTKEEKPMSNGKAALVIVMTLVMYAMISAVPTFVMMHFFDISFWLTQLFVVIGLVIISLMFGLHKPASNEQKLKSKYLI